MNQPYPVAKRSLAFQDRRTFVRYLGLAAAFFTVPGVFAEELIRTPRLTEGPFYPDKLPLDTDNDLLIINDSITPAVGEVTWLNGRILDSHGDPVRNALVEIWQVDSHGVYLHTQSSNSGKRDTHFQGFGRFLTGSSGEYQFRTLKPVPYPGRTPHIHFAVKTKNQEKFTTQCFIRGEAQNSRDFVLNSVRDQRGRDSVIVPFVPLQNPRSGDLAAHFDIVLGFTPEA